MNRVLPYLIVAFLLLGLPRPGDAQAVESRSIQTISLDPARGLRLVVLPFQEQFLLSVPRLNGATEIEISLTPTRGGGVSLSERFRPGLGAGGETVSFLVPELPARRDYSIAVRWWLTDAAAARAAAACTALLTTPRSSTCIDEPFLGETAAPWTRHFDTDFGIVHAPTDVGLTGLVLAAHLHFAPINKNTPWTLVSGDPLRTFSIFAGLSIATLGVGTPVEKPSKAGMPVIGVGIRAIDPLRVLMGGVFFQQVDANPLVDTKNDKWAPFIGLSLDLEVQGILGPIAGAVGIGG